MTAKSYELTPMNVGATVRGIDPADIGDAELGKALYADWLRYGFLVFRDLPLDNDQHIAFSNHFGVAEIHPLPAIRAAENPLFMELGGKKPGKAYVFDGKLLTGRVPWHRDTAYTLDICKGAVLRVVQRPAEGGNTGFCDTAAAYDALPEPMKRKIETLECKATLKLDPFDFKYGMTWTTARDATDEEVPDNPINVPLEEQNRFPSIVIPMVITHPETGRKSIYISPTYLDCVIGMEEDEGHALLTYLVDHLLKPDFVHTHEWREGDVVTWDNRRMLHNAEGYPPSTVRRLLRTTLAGPLHIGRMFDPDAKQRAADLVD